MCRFLCPIFLLCCNPAWSGLIEVACEECRNPEEYPRDFGNQAVNQLFGCKRWLTLAQGDQLKITNLNGESAMVDLNLVVMSLNFIINTTQIPAPNLFHAGTIQVLVYTKNRTVLDYRIHTALAPLDVGSREPSTGGPAGASRDGVTMRCRETNTLSRTRAASGTGVKAYDRVR